LPNHHGSTTEQNLPTKGSQGGILVMRFLQALIITLTSIGCWACSPLFWGQVSDPVITGSGDPCFNITKENSTQPVIACEYERSYKVQILSDQQQFPKRLFQRRFYDQLRSFFQRSAVPQKSMAGVQVDFWLVAPIFDPNEAHWVAVVATDEGFLGFRLPLSPEAWHLTGADSFWLGTKDHPSRQAIRSDQLVLTAQPSQAPSQVLHFLEDSGLTQRLDPLKRPLVDAIVGDGSVIRLDTRALGAPMVAKLISRLPDVQSQLMAVNFVRAPGVDCYQAKVFRFTLPTYP
jgi:hypothetical protein